MNGGLIGKSVPRREDVRLSSGRGQFVADLVGKSRQCCFVRSSHAAARIVDIDISAALRHPGIVAVVTAADLPEYLGGINSLTTPNPRFVEAFAYQSADRVIPLLADTVVTYVGEPVACVVANSRAVAEDAVELVRIEYEPLPAIVDPFSALDADSRLIHEELSDNVAASLQGGFGDLAEAEARAAHTARMRLRLGRHGGLPLETRGVVAEWDSRRGRVDVWTSTQVPHMVSRAICTATGWASNEVRVVAPDVGGGFGPKANVYPEEILLPWLARHMEMKLAWIEDRAEHFQATAQGRDQTLNVALHVNTAGLIVGWDVDYIADVGSGSLWVAGVIANTALHLLGPYRVPNYRVRGRAVFTNKTIVAQYRGAGRPEASFAIERALDKAAALVGISALEIRRRNILNDADLPHDISLPYRDGVGVRYDCADFSRCLDDVASHCSTELVNRVRETHPELSVGCGIATYMEATGRGPHEAATVQLEDDGSFSVWVGSTSTGQGHETSLAQVACDALGVPFDAVHVRRTDTHEVRDGIGTFASRSAVVGGSAVHRVCVALRERAEEIVAEWKGVHPADVQADIEGVRCRNRHISWGDLATALRPGQELEHRGRLRLEQHWSPETVTWTMGAHGAIVGVHEKTGRVAVLDYIVSHEGGKEINPAIVAGQVIGGVTQGIGGALLEEFEYAKDGQPQTSSFAHYLLPTVMEVPEVTINHHERVSELNPIGVKGVGESGTIAVYAAVAAAIEDAIDLDAGSITCTPVTPEVVGELLEGKRS